MKWLVIFCILTSNVIAQNFAAENLTGAEIRLSTPAKGVELRHYYKNNVLIALQKTERGELANTIETTWYFDGDFVRSAVRRKCRTDDTQILDLGMYNEKHRLPDGTVDYSGLPVNCMTLTVDFTSARMTRTIEGMDVFAQPDSYSKTKKLLYESYLSLVEDISLN